MSESKESVGRLIWITGLPGAGKTTIAKEVVEALKEIHGTVIHLDGDAFREIFFNELGYDTQDRIKNARLIARFCAFLVSQGAQVVCSTVSLYHEIHEYNRKHNGNYFEIFIEVEFEDLVARDQKGLYSGAKSGDVENVLGLNQNYERPMSPNLVIYNNVDSILASNVEVILENLVD